MSLNVRAYNNKEMLLFPARIGDYLSKDHLAWIVDDVVDDLDLRCLYDKLSSTGNPSYHPKMMIKLLFYAYTQKVFTSRRIAGKLNTDVAFIFLTGMQRPDFRTIADFRKNNLAEISDLFVQIVRLCKELDMIELGHVSIDSTVIKANASNKNTCSRDTLEREDLLIKEKIDEFFRKSQNADEKEDEEYGRDNPGDGIPAHIRNRKVRLEKIKAAKETLKRDNRKDINLTDKDATTQRSKGGLVIGYRAQMSVDKKEQIIVACDVASNSADAKQLKGMVDKTCQNTQKDDNKKTILTADSAYSSMANLKELGNKPNIDPYIPDAAYQATKRNKKKNESSVFYTHNFVYQPHNNSYLCSNNQEIPFVSKKIDRDGRRFSTYRGRNCRKCVYFGLCTTSRWGRNLRIYDDIHLIHKMRVKLNTPEGMSIYRKRLFIIEPVIGNIKHNLGFRQFFLRGMRKTKAEFTLIAIGHNLLKIAKFVKRQGLSISKSKYPIPVPS